MFIWIWDFVAATVMDNILDWIHAQIIGFLANFFAQMGNMGVELFDLLWVQAVVRFFSQLGWALFGVSLVVCAFECGIEYSSGRGHIQQTALNVLKGFLAASLFTTVPVRLYALSVSLQNDLTQGIAGSGKTIGEVGQDIIREFTTVDGLAEALEKADFGLGLITSPIMFLFCIIMMAYAVIKVFFANLKRGGILLIQIAVGSLYMFSIPRGYSDGFTMWIKQVIGLCLTAFYNPRSLSRDSWRSKTMRFWASVSCCQREKCRGLRARLVWIQPPMPISKAQSIQRSQPSTQPKS